MTTGWGGGRLSRFATRLGRVGAVRSLVLLIVVVLVADVVALSAERSPGHQRVASGGGGAATSTSASTRSVGSVGAANDIVTLPTAPSVSVPDLPSPTLPPDVPVPTLPGDLGDALGPDVPGAPCPSASGASLQGSERAPDHAGAYVTDAEGSFVRVLTDQPATAVSPDGRYFAFYGPEGQLCIGPTAGGPSTALRWQLPGEPLSASERAATPWSPDGARLLVLRRDGSTNDVFVVDIASRRFGRVTPPEAATYDGADWAPDSVRVAVSGSDGVTVMSISGFELAHPISGAAAMQGVLQWAPMIDEIYVRFQPGYDQLVPAAGGAAIDVGGYRQYAWRADGSAAVRPVGPTGQFGIRSPDGSYHSIFDEPAVFEVELVRWSGDAHRVLYIGRVSSPPDGHPGRAIGYMVEDGSHGSPMVGAEDSTGFRFSNFFSSGSGATVVYNVAPL